MLPVLFEIGPLTVYSYGLMMALGFLAGTALTARELARHKLNPEFASSILWWAIIGGLVGSRLLAIVEDIPAFLADPVGGIFTGAGFVWHGGFLGGLLAVSLWIYRSGLSWPLVADCIAPGLCLGHGIGRIGCLLAGDGCWGTVTTLPWGMAFPHGLAGWEHPPGIVVHPTPLYEFLAYAAIAGWMWSVRTQPHRPGLQIYRYLLLGGIARFVIEIVRVNPAILAGLSQAQWISLGMVAVGGVLWWRNRGAPLPAAAAAR